MSRRTPLKVVVVHNKTMWYRLPFFRALAKRYDLTIFFTDASSVEGLEGVKYELLKRYLNKWRTISAFGDIFAPGLIFRLLFMDFDVVVAGLFDIISFLVAKVKRKPFILWSELWNFSEREHRAFKLLYPYFTFIISRADALLVPSQVHKNEMISLGATASKTFIMRNVSNIYVTDSDYEKAKDLRELLDTDKTAGILYVGRLIESKGVQYLITAFAKLIEERKDLALVCIGDGPFREHLESLCTELNVERYVRFTGRLDLDIERNKYVVPYYLWCDVCVVPSIFLRGMPDPCPLVVNEAMGCGRAVIATTAVGCAHDAIINGKNGFIVPEKDSTALYTALRMVLADHSTARAMGEESKKIIEDSFTYTDMTNAFQRALDYVMHH